MIRDIAIKTSGTGVFDYSKFQASLRGAMFSQGQNQPLRSRIDLLESFLDILENTPIGNKRLKPKPKLVPRVTQDYLVGK